MMLVTVRPTYQLFGPEPELRDVTAVFGIYNIGMAIYAPIYRGPNFSQSLGSVHFISSFRPLINISVYRNM